MYTKSIIKIKMNVGKMRLWNPLLMLVYFISSSKELEHIYSASSILFSLLRNETIYPTGLRYVLFMLCHPVSWLFAWIRWMEIRVGRRVEWMV
jgi:hypothetical protein